jgi:hypothetical protein
MKTSELTGAALDWAVCEATGLLAAYTQFRTGKNFLKVWGVARNTHLHPSTDWAQGGPIIDREDIAMSSKPDGLWAAYAPKGTRLVQHGGKDVEVFNWYFKQEGFTPLIAAMRCYVASKLGDDVDVPEELQ